MSKCFKFGLYQKNMIRQYALYYIYIIIMRGVRGVCSAIYRNCIHGVT